MAEAGNPVVGIVQDVRGHVTASSGGEQRVLQSGDYLYANEVLILGSQSSAIALIQGREIVLNENTQVTIPVDAGAEINVVQLAPGVVESSETTSQSTAEEKIPSSENSTAAENLSSSSFENQPSPSDVSATSASDFGLNLNAETNNPAAFSNKGSEENSILADSQADVAQHVFSESPAAENPSSEDPAPEDPSDPISSESPRIDLNGATEDGADFSTAFNADHQIQISVAAPDAVITDTDSSTLSSFTISITNAQDGAAEWLAADVTGTQIQAQYDSASHLLTLSGDDTLAHYSQVLQNITYHNVAEDPSMEARVLEFKASDGVQESDPVTGTVNVMAFDPDLISDPDIQGTDNADNLKGKGSSDTIDAGAGDDTVDARGGNDLVAGGAGDDSIAGGAGKDQLYGQSGDDHLKGDGGNDELYGGLGADVLEGGAGSDSLSGGRGDDRLEGGGGNDTFIGGLGDDQMTGAGGKDKYVYEGILDQEGNPIEGHDVITDFQTGDQVDISALLDALGKTDSDVQLTQTQTGVVAQIATGVGNNSYAGMSITFSGVSDAADLSVVDGSIFLG